MTKRENTRAKYGKRMRPAPLVVKSLETGEVIARHKNGVIPKPLTRKQAWFIKKLRREMGIEITSLPTTAHAGAQVIEALMRRRG